MRGASSGSVSSDALAHLPRSAAQRNRHPESAMADRRPRSRLPTARAVRSRACRWRRDTSPTGGSKSNSSSTTRRQCPRSDRRRINQPAHRCAVFTGDGPMTPGLQAPAGKPAVQCVVVDVLVDYPAGSGTRPCEYQAPGPARRSRGAGGAEPARRPQRRRTVDRVDMHTGRADRFERLEPRRIAASPELSTTPRASRTNIA
jgi:hypothetical protein